MSVIVQDSVLFNRKNSCKVHSCPNGSQCEYRLASMRVINNNCDLACCSTLRTCAITDRPPVVPIDELDTRHRVSFAPGIVGSPILPMRALTKGEITPGSSVALRKHLIEGHIQMDHDSTANDSHLFDLNFHMPLTSAHPELKPYKENKVKNEIEEFAKEEELLEPENTNSPSDQEKFKPEMRFSEQTNKLLDLHRDYLIQLNDMAQQRLSRIKSRNIQ